MNFFKRIASFFRKSKPTQPAATVLITPDAAATPRYNIPSANPLPVQPAAPDKDPFAEFNQKLSLAPVIPSYIDYSPPFTGFINLRELTRADATWFAYRVNPVWGMPPIRDIFGGCTLNDYNSWINGPQDIAGDRADYDSLFARALRAYAETKGVKI